MFVGVGVGLAGRTPSLGVTVGEGVVDGVGVAVGSTDALGVTLGETEIVGV